jgi:uncharacterized membrane protein
MVIMALDHTRDYIHSAAMVSRPEDLATTTPAIFFTRWITHFCAPVFMFCAGIGAWLRLQRGGTTGDLSRFLLTRGVWLILLEVTLVRLGFFFNLDYSLLFLLVFWALGLSMIALALLVHLPYRVLVAVSLVLIVLHNLTDALRAASFGSFAWLWHVLHQPGVIQTPGPALFVAYPLVPWIGVMAAGFCLGRMYAPTIELAHPRFSEGGRSRFLIRLGLVLTAAFVVLRVINLYGDPAPWSGQRTPIDTVLSFLNTTKYPPSLQFLLMTLGPAIALLGWIDGARPREGHPLLVFGRVPLFYFVVHLPLIHALAIVLTWITYGAQSFLFTPPPTLGTSRDLFPPGYGWSLGVAYLVWIAAVAILYPICLWFSRVKQRRREWWISYL